MCSAAPSSHSFPSFTAETLIMQVNIEGTRNLIECALECGVPRLVNTSTYNVVYGGRVRNPARWLHRFFCQHVWLVCCRFPPDLLGFCFCLFWQPIEGGDEILPYFPLERHVDEYSRSKAIAEMEVR